MRLVAANTRYGKHVSYSFSISDVSLPAGQSVGIGVNRTSEVVLLC